VKERALVSAVMNFRVIRWGECLDRLRHFILLFEEGLRSVQSCHCHRHRHRHRWLRTALFLAITQRVVVIS